MYPNLNAGAIGVKADLATVINYAKEYGFEGVDFSIVEAMNIVESQGKDYLKRLFEDSGVKPGAWGFPVEYRDDHASWERSMDALPALADLAVFLGCLRTSTWIVPGDDTRNFFENFHFYLKRIGPAAKVLAERDICLGLEFIGPKTLRDTKKYPFIHTLEGMRALGAAMGTGNVGILLDIWHLYTSHGTLVDVRELDVEDVVVVHINDAPAGVDVDRQLDNVRALPGETGVLDIAGFLQTLEDMDYDGPITPEPFSQRVRQMAPAEAVQATAESVRKVWGEAFGG